MARKILIDCDPGIDDAVALCLALFDPRVEVVGITATAGVVSVVQANRNVQTIVDRLDPPRFPIFGAGSPAENAPNLDACFLHGSDGLGDADFLSVDLHNPRPAEKVIVDTIRAYPEELTILALGPLTNIAMAFQLDRELPSMVGRLVICGGSITGVGNITPAAEFNMYYDPTSAQAIFRSPTTKTLVPLETTSRLQLPLDFIDQLPNESTRAGAFLRKIIPYAYRSQRQHLGREMIHLHGVMGLMPILYPELFETQEMTGDVETCGELTTGATVFDRRSHHRALSNMDAVVGVHDIAQVKLSIIRGLRYAGQETG